LEPGEKFTDWEWFESLASDLISPRIKINLREEADKAASDFTAAIALAYSFQQVKLHFRA
jgi:hypothetical protein